MLLKSHLCAMTIIQPCICFVVLHTAISIGFSFKEYTVQEDDGAITPGPVTILKENGVVSEQDLPVAVRLIELGQAIPGTLRTSIDTIIILLFLQSLLLQ